MPQSFYTGAMNTATADVSRSARDRILFQLKTRGPQTSRDLARRLEVTPMAIRLHLQPLLADGLVTYADEQRKRGRPARLWSLTPAAARRFPDSHGDLTVELLRAVRSTFGDDGLDRLVAERSRQQRQSYLDRMPSPDAPFEVRLAALANIRSQEGYMAEWSREADGSWLLSENHCPICAAASVCQGFCRDELEMFRELLAPGTDVTRTDHVLAGARRCAYRITAVPTREAATSSTSETTRTTGDPA
jgi:predicted ArsR family transcriptional regulator